MGRIAVIGAEPLVRGFAVAGAVVVPAESPPEVRRAWDGLPADVLLVVLTRDAADALAGDTAGRLTAVMPP